MFKFMRLESSKRNFHMFHNTSLSIFDMTFAAVLVLTQILSYVEERVSGFTEPLAEKFKSSRIGRIVLRPVGYVESITGVSIDFDVGGVIISMGAVVMFELMRAMVGSCFYKNPIETLGSLVLSKKIISYISNHLIRISVLSVLLGRSPTPNRVLGAVLIAVVGYMLVLYSEDIGRFFHLRRITVGTVGKLAALLGEEKACNVLRYIPNEKEKKMFSKAIEATFEFVKTVDGAEKATQGVNEIADAIIHDTWPYLSKLYRDIFVARVFSYSLIALISGLLILSRRTSGRRKSSKSKKKTCVPVVCGLVITLFIIPVITKNILNPQISEALNQYNDKLGLRKLVPNLDEEDGWEFVSSGL